MTIYHSPQVVLFVADVSRAAAFYAGLGFHEEFRAPQAGDPIHVDIELDDYRIGLASVDSARADHGLDPVVAGQRATVAVWTADVAQAYAELTGRGVVGLQPPRPWRDRLLIAWVEDPDGNPVQLVQPAADQST